MFKAMIFDMDGVIVDSEPLFFEVAKRLLQKYGVELTEEVNDRYVGIASPGMWTDLKNVYSLEPGLEELLALHEEIRGEVFAETQLAPVEGIRELLADLAAEKIPAAIASSSALSTIYETIDSLGIRSHFEAFVSGEEIERGKPFPDIFLKAAELLGVRPEECVVLEDSAHGVKAAALAGMKCIGYANPRSGKQDLSEATCIVADLRNVDVSFIRGLFRPFPSI